MRLEVFEIFDQFKKASNKKERVAVLQKYSKIPAFSDVLRATFDDKLQFNLPEGSPPYTPNKPESTPSTLLKKHMMFSYFVKGFNGDSLPAFKRENLFIQLLESVHPEDAKIVLGMKDKDLKIKFLTKKLVQEALPDLIKD